MSAELKPSSVAFHYLKSNYFRVIHVDGAYGGLTPYGGIFMALYNDRTSLPDKTVQPVGENGMLGPEIPEQTVVRGGVEREVEACIVMNLNTAKALQQWLEERIKIAEKMHEERQESEVKS